MANDYFVRVLNKSSETQNYLLFNDPPTRGDLGTPYSNVWERSPGVFSPNGTAKFQFSTDVYAVCGSTVSKQALGVKMQIDTSDFARVTLTEPKKDGVNVNMDVQSGGVGFKPPPGTVTEAGSYGIKTASFDLNRYTYFWCGMGKLDSDGNVQPCVTWQAKPTKSYVVTPILKFWVSTGTYTPGMVVDQTMFGEIADIDFTGRSENIATITHNSNGTYSAPEYSHSKSVKYEEIVGLRLGATTGRGLLLTE